MFSFILPAFCIVLSNPPFLSTHFRFLNAYTQDRQYYLWSQFLSMKVLEPSMIDIYRHRCLLYRWSAFTQCQYYAVEFRNLAHYTDNWVSQSIGGPIDFFGYWYVTFWGIAGPILSLSSPPNLPKTLIFRVCILLDFRAISPQETRLYWPGV